MERVDGGIRSSYEGGIREDFFFTFNEEEKKQNEINENNASLVLRPEFIPLYIELNGMGFSLLDKVIYGFLRFFLKNNEKFYCTNDQLAELFEVSGATISSSIAKLEKMGIIELHYKIKAGGGKIRFICPTSKFLKSDIKKFDGIENKIIKNKIIGNEGGSLRSPATLIDNDNLNREASSRQTHSKHDEKRVEKDKKKIEIYDDIKQLKDDQWRSFNKMALRCLDYMMQLGYRIDYTEKALDDYIQRLRDKARDYNLKLPSGEINWGEIVKRVGSWKSYHEEKGDKIKIYKTSVEKFFR